MATINNSREVALQATVPKVLVSQVSLAGSSPGFTKTKNGGAITPSSITLTSSLSVAGVYTSPVYAWAYSLNSAPDTWITISGATSSTLAITNSVYSGYVGTNAFVRYKCTVSQPTRLTTVAYYDVFYTKEADDAVEVQLSNPAIVVPASSTGVVSVYTNTGATIRVLRGSTYLTYAASGADTFSVSGPTILPTGAITAPNNSSTASTYTIADITAMTQAASVVTSEYIVTVRDAAAAATTYTVVQKFNKVNQLSNSEVSGTYGDASTLGLNGSYENWSSNYPDTWVNWSGAAPTKETTITRNGIYSAKYTTAGGADLGMSKTINLSTTPLAVGSYLTGTVDFYLVAVISGTGLPGILVRLYTNAALTTSVDTKIQPSSITTALWQRIPWTARVGNDQQIYGVQIFAMASWTSFALQPFNGTVCFDNIDFYIQQSDAATNPATADLTLNSFVLPADSTGLVSDFAGAATTMTVYRKNVDDSSFWTFSVSASDASITSTASGSPSGRTRTITAIGNSVDTGYIDITATPNASLTASGYVAITKRFSVSKNKAAVRAQGVYTGLSLSSINAQVGASTWAGIIFKSNGVINTRGPLTGDSVDSGFDWYGPTATTGIGAGYYIKIVNQSGTVPSTVGITLGTWTVMSADTQIFVSKSVTGVATSSNVFSISTSSTGSPIVASGTIYLEAERA